jgi:hypothetical protein
MIATHLHELVVRAGPIALASVLTRPVFRGGFTARGYEPVEINIAYRNPKTRPVLGNEAHYEGAVQ